MNFQNILTQWLLSLSEDDSINITKVINTIKETCQSITQTQISDNIKTFCSKIIGLIQQGSEVASTKIKLLSCITAMMDFYFINSFPSITCQFEEFMKTNVNITENTDLINTKLGESCKNDNQRVSSEPVSISTKEQATQFKEIRMEEIESSVLTLWQLSSKEIQRLESLEKFYDFKFEDDWPVRIGCEISRIRPHIPIRCSSQLVIEKINHHLIAHETSTNNPGAKFQIFQSIIEQGQIFSLGDTKLTVLSIDKEGNLDLEFELNNRIYTKHLSPYENGDFSIGRTRLNVLRFIDDAKMSKMHATISREGKLWVIKDKQSRNGVWKFLHTAYSTGRDSNRIELSDDTKFNFCEAIFQSKIRIYP